MGICDQDFRGALFHTSFDCGICFLGHQVSALLVGFTALARIRLDLADDSPNSLHVDRDVDLPHYSPGLAMMPRGLTIPPGRLRQRSASRFFACALVPARTVMAR